MTKNCTPASIMAVAPKSDFRLTWQRFLGLFLLVWLATSLTARAAEEPLDAKYVRIYRMIDQGDSFAAAGNQDLAKQTYRDAQVALQDFKKNNPGWNSAAVAYRLDYLAEKINPRAAVIPVAAENTVVAPKPAAKPAAKKVAPLPGSTVKLIDPGAEPRKQIRIHPKVGDKQNLNFTTKTAVDMGTGQTMKMPATKMSMEITIKNISVEGDISYDAIIGDATVLDEPGAMPQIVESIKASLNGMKGLAMKGVMSDRGVTKSFDVKIPAGLAPQMRQAMEQMKESMANISAPFPDEAIGAGAKWEVKLPVKSQGMTIDQVTTYELISLKEDAANVTSKITQNAAKQKITNPATPQIKMDLIKLTGEGTGNATSIPSKLFPVLGSAKSSTATSIGMNVSGQVQEMNMKMEMNMQLESK